MPAARPIDHVHLLHQLLVGQIGVSLGDAGVVQREKGEAISETIEPPKSGDLRAAEIALAVKNHDVAFWEGVRIGQFGSAKHRFLVEKGDFALNQLGGCPLYLA